MKVITKKDLILTKDSFRSVSPMMVDLFFFLILTILANKLFNAYLLA